MYRIQISIILCSILLSLSVAARTVVHDETFVPDEVLWITEQEYNQSCIPERRIVTVNGTVPGPTLYFKEGTTTWIRVYNQMPDQNFTIHWHGLAQAGAPFSDGTPGVAQWPIPPLHYFDYEINVPFGKAGTYFYHSHVGFDFVTANGPIIVEEAEGPPPYKYDEERIFHINDIFNKTDKEIEEGMVASPMVWSGTAATLLINGQGGDAVNCKAPISSFNVEPGKTYRFRFISSAVLTITSVIFEDHNMTVIAADAFYTDPYDISYLQIAGGQRFDILLTTKSAAEKPKQSYSIQVESRETGDTIRSYAVLNYGPQATTPIYPPISPTVTVPAWSTDFLEYVLHPLSNQTDVDNSTTGKLESFPTAEEVTRRVFITMHQATTGQTIWYMNGANWTDKYPTEPYLVSMYKNDGVEYPDMTRAIANGGLDPVTRAFPADIGEVLEIVIQNTGSDTGDLVTHPFHFHGQHYWDLGRGPGIYNSTENDAKWNALGKSPIKRDTTMVHAFTNHTTPGEISGWRAWRTRAEQPGAWMIHCHVLQHVLMGMQTVWVIGNATEIHSLVSEEDAAGYLTFGGNVNGNSDRAPRVLHYFDDDWVQEQ